MSILSKGEKKVLSNMHKRHPEYDAVTKSVASGLAEAKSSAIKNKKEKKHENNLFKNVDRTIKRIKEGGHDSRYDN